MSEGAVVQKIAVLGGTGKEGNGLVYRWAQAGYPIIIGSRSAEKAAEAAAQMTQRLGGAASVSGLANPDAAAQADLVVLAVPYAAHSATLESVKSFLGGKVLL